MTRARILLVALAALLLVAACVQAAQAQSLTTGFSGYGFGTSDTLLSRAVAEGAGLVRLNVDWAAVAPEHRPAGFDPTNPKSAGYDWTSIDDQVRRFSRHGLKVLMSITTAPTWAEGPNMPRSAGPGTWRPSPAQYGAFTAAAARRYDGSFPDPLQPGNSLPRVRDWQGWDEPNLAFYLTPSWIRRGRRYVAESPTIFRNLSNALYKSVKAASRSNFVVLGGTAPYGDSPGGERIPPAEFDRDLFCLSGVGYPEPTRCSNPVHADAIDHHPYGVAGPLSPAGNTDDVAVPDIHKVTRELRAAERSGHILPRGPKRVWVTEISWDSSPPDPDGVPIQRQARWYEQSMNVLWRQGVETVLFLQLIDAPPTPNYATTYQAGLYYLNGRPKPAAVAFRFPFVTRRLDSGHIQAWGWAPQSGTVTIQQQLHGSWRVLKRLSVRDRQIYLRTLPIRGHATLRAQIGSQTSLSWKQS